MTCSPSLHLFYVEAATAVIRNLGCCGRVGASAPAALFLPHPALSLLAHIPFTLLAMRTAASHLPDRLGLGELMA